MRISDWSSDVCSSDLYKASDGLEIEAILTTPRLRAGQKKLPVVVLTHGGPYGVRDYASYDQWAQTIAEQGYVVVQPNYRGSGGYGNAFVKAGRSDGFGTRMQDELNAVVDQDRKSVVKGTRVSVRVDLGGSRIIKKKK